MAISKHSAYKTALVSAARPVALALLFSSLAALAGCAALGPPQTVVSLYGEHVSHITQHQPFTSDPTDYGYNTVNLAVTVETRKSGPFLTLADGYNLTRGGNYRFSNVTACPAPSVSSCQIFSRPHSFQEFGALAGPREVFSARAGWRWVFR